MTITSKQCNACGATYYPNPKSHKDFSLRKFCSHKCAMKARIGTKGHPGIKGPRVARVKRNCGICGIEFELVPSLAKTTNYCSRKCAVHAPKNVPSKLVYRIIKCRQCKKEFSRYVPYIKNIEKSFCSQRCASLFTCKRGKDHPGWKGDKASKETGRGRAQVKFPLKNKMCEIHPLRSAKLRHHRDGNPLNNNPKNIIYLCSVGCHNTIHAKLIPKLLFKVCPFCKVLFKTEALGLKAFYKRKYCSMHCAGKINGTINPRKNI